jgi:nucleoside-diphosphate-sugar epimerase
MLKPMPHPPRALPRRFRQPRLLLVGCGDVAARLAGQIGSRYRLRALLRHEPDSSAWQDWRTLGATPVAADLDQPATLQRIRGVATHIIYLAPPADSNPAKTPADARLNHFLAALNGGASLPRRLVYIGTSGVYGDCQGARVHESQPVQPQTARGQRRAAAEATLRRWARTRIRASAAPHLRPDPVRIATNAGSILRVPGIYAGNRLPADRLRAGTPALRPEDDTWTNHIHADDLARICWLSLTRGRSLRAYNTSDNSALKMGDWFDAVADACHLPRPQRLPREQLKSLVSPMLYSFMSESRRLDNERLRKELRIQLRYPTVHDFLATLKASAC